jgi:signal recognition particle subunit SRP54
MASRVLGMGDVVGLIQDFEAVVDQKQAEVDAARMMSGKFTLEDFLNQVRMLQKMGSLSDLVDKIPGLSGMVPPGAAQSLDDRELVRIEAMIQSMTLDERDDPNALVREPSRVRRISRGSGQPAEAVSELVQKFLFMRQMMGGFGQNSGLLGQIPGMKNVAMMNQARKAMKGGFPGMGIPGMGFPGMGMPGLAGQDEAPRMRVLSKAERNARKTQRKRERDARKKGKKR